MCRKTLVAMGILALAPLVGCGGDGDNGGSSDAATDRIQLPDGGMDGGGMDGSGMDGGGMDGGGMDSGGPRCNVGNACDPTSGAGCTGGNECQQPLGAAAPIPVVNPDGTSTGMSIPVQLFQGGYCMPDAVLSGSSFRETCNPNDEMDTTCGDCATCVTLFRGATACLRTCTYNLMDNDVCRDGYACTTGDFCLDGCSTDLECQVYRADLDGDMNPETVLDPDLSSATCNMDTYRCETPGKDGAKAGDPCERDSQCQANGRCLDEANFNGWQGGYCTKFRCDVDPCAAGDKCQSRGIGISLCLAPCTVGHGSDGNPVDASDPSTWLTANGGCRDGYTCVWDGEGTGDDNGSCVGGGNYNDVTTENIGSRCRDEEDCWSPFGQGFCITEDVQADGSVTFPGGYCSIRDCAAEGLPEDVCGSGNACVTGLADDPTFGICFATCTSGADCRNGYGCVDIDGPMGPRPSICLMGCSQDSDCPLDGQTCMGATPTSLGACVGGTAGSCRNDADCRIGSVCEGFDESTGTLGTCQEDKCRADTDCVEGLCENYDASTGTLGTCRADACREDGDCTEGLCVGASADMLGTCTPGACRGDDDCPMGATCNIMAGETIGSCMMPADS